jgi:Mrp family chromosome partitioning ATPase
VVVVGDYPQALHDVERTEIPRHPAADATLPDATRVAGNLWLLPSSSNDGKAVTRASLHLYLGAVRNSFDYSIVVGPPAAEPTATTAMAQVADGIVLILSAQRTRRITARKVKEKLELAQARLLGIVLSDRAFPIPERIYRRL